MNIPLLRQIQEKILAESILFDMGTFVCTNYPDSGGCYTSFCIAGWAVQLTDGSAKEYHEKSGISYKAVKLLELDQRKDQDSLFFTCDWPGEWEDKHSEANTHYDRARVASDLIDEFINNPDMFIREDDDESDDADDE